MGKILFVALGWATSFAAHVWVLSCAWDWFARPLGAPRVSVWFLAGFSVLWSYLHWRRDWAAEEAAEKARAKGDLAAHVGAAAFGRAGAAAVVVGLMWVIRALAGV